MPKFSFKFEAVLRYRKHRRQLCQQMLARVLATTHELASQQSRLEQLRAGLLDEIRQLSDTGEVDVDRSSARRYYAGYVSVQIIEVQRNQQLVARQVASCRDALTKADQAVKMLDKLEEKQRQEYLYHEERRTALALDDLWTASRMAETAS